MEPVYQDLPDDHWRHAATVAFTALHAPLTQLASARVVLRPWRSPDGAILPYSIRVEATRADGAPGMRATAIVWGDKLANGGGAAAATGVLAAAGFPAKPIAVGHLLDVLYLTGAIDPSWIQPPSLVGWDRAANPSLAAHPEPTIDHARTGAVLHLYRAIASPGGAVHPGPGGPGGSVTLPAMERLDVTFDAKAGFTRTVLRQNAARTAWEAVH